MIPAEKLRPITWLVLDVDGVLTDGRIIYTDAGQELKQFHSRDGFGLRLWARAGHKAAIITGRTSRVVEIRAKELGISPVFQGSRDKGLSLAEFLRQTGADAAACCAVGDDIPDMPLLRGCGVGVAVADAGDEAKAAAGHVTRLPGGRGAVREVIEWILKAQGRWDELIAAH